MSVGGVGGDFSKTLKPPALLLGRGSICNALGLGLSLRASFRVSVRDRVRLWTDVSMCRPLIFAAGGLMVVVSVF